VNTCEVTAHLIGSLASNLAPSFWQPIFSGLNLVVAAVLRDSLCVVSLASCLIYARAFIEYVCGCVLFQDVTVREIRRR